MAFVKPFRGIRPVKDKVHLVASRTVDSYSKSDVNEKLIGNPYTFLHVINPDFSDGIKTKSGSVERLKKIKKRFIEFCDEGIYVQDASEKYYIYRQSRNKYSYTGIIACINIDDYINGTIRVHEQTLAERENKLKNYLDVCNFNAEPVLFSFEEDIEISSLLKNITTTNPEYDYTTTDKVRHTLWVVETEATVNCLSERFASIPKIYIADGHHRSASSALLGAERRINNKQHKGDEPYNFYLGIFFPESELRIFDYNRVVKDLNGLTPNLLLERLSGDFEVSKVYGDEFSPSKQYEFGMYIDGCWYSLKINENLIEKNNPEKSLDASLLTNHILTPLLGINDLRTDKRISFVPGINGTAPLKAAVDSGKGKVAFSLFPVQMSQLKNIADSGYTMPPKTTWIEPKLRSGLVVYRID